jgi:undecaprenyl-phosphate 4-deoxy-4-formamido-L-arabinose transferase
MKISFVIPCYRSETTIGGVVSELLSVVSQRPDVDYEIIMVSDHSPDNVYRVIERMCRKDPERLQGIELARNFGQHSALMAGYAHAKGDVIFSLDDDGQAPVESVFAVLDKLEDEDYDVVFGSYPAKKHSLFRNFGSQVNDFMLRWLLNKPKSLRITSFFAMRRFVSEAMLSYSGAFPYIAGLLFRVTKNIGNVEVRHRERADGVSGYTIRKLLSLWLNGFTAFSVKPLQVATFAGLAMSVAGFAFGIWTIVRKLFIAPDMPIGYSSTMSVLLLTGGMLMIMLGLIGEYIGRIYICINQSPQYVIRRQTREKR